MVSVGALERALPSASRASSEYVKVRPYPGTGILKEVFVVVATVEVALESLKKYVGVPEGVIGVHKKSISRVPELNSPRKFSIAGRTGAVADGGLAGKLASSAGGGVLDIPQLIEAIGWGGLIKLACGEAFADELTTEALEPSCDGSVGAALAAGSLSALAA